MKNTTTKILILAALSTSLWASPSLETKNAIKNFINNTIQSSPIKLISVKYQGEKKINRTGWTGYQTILSFDTEEGFLQIPRLIFSDGKMISENIFHIESDTFLSEMYPVVLSNKEYTAERLLAGNKDAKNKILVFSDPLCPFCKEAIPGILAISKKSPEKFAIYLVHTPLKMHPAAKTLCKVMIASRNKKEASIVEKLYLAEIDPEMTDEKDILKVVSKVTGNSYTVKEINTKKILDELKEDSELKLKGMVSSTPTFFSNGKKLKNLSLFN